MYHCFALLCCETRLAHCAENEDGEHAVHKGRINYIPMKITGEAVYELFLLCKIKCISDLVIVSVCVCVCV